MRQCLILLWTVVLTTAAWASPWVVAHRGGPTTCGQENRLETYKNAITLGVDAIELDIHQTLDGRLVVIHDVTLARTFEGHAGRVDEMTLSELQEIGVPTLEQALDVAKGRCRLLIEIKQPKDRPHIGIEQKLVDLLREKQMIPEVVVISFSADSLRKVHELEPKILTGYLTGASIPVEKAKKLGVTYIAPHYLSVDAGYVKSVHDAGLKINVWTVDKADAQEKMLEAGCDAITTNDPEVLLKMREQVERAPATLH